MFRSLIAFVLAPFPAAIFQASVVAAWPKEGMGVFEHPLSMFAAICLLFYIFGMLLGLPLIWLFRKRPNPAWRGYALGGAAAISSPVIIAMIVAVFSGQLSLYIVLYNLLFFAIGGALAGLVFYRLRRRSEKITQL